jgi:single-stranded DNA-specific DHH superfamily exonuclease
MVKITKEKAKEFLETISEKDHIAIFYHTDLDGFASGILFYDFCISKGCKNIQTHKINYGINKLSNFDLKKVTKILIADLAPGVVSEDLSNLKNKQILYSDHHQEDKNFPIPKEVLELRTTDQGYIPSSRTIYELCEGKYWLSVMGVLSDFGEKHEINRKFLDSFVKESGKSLEYLKQDIMYTISRAIIYFEKHTETNFFDILKNINFMEDINRLEEFEKPVKKEFNGYIEDFEKNSEKLGKIIFYYFSPEYNIKSFIINSLSSKNPDKIYILAVPKNKELIGLSARNQSQEYDVAKTLQECTKNLKEGWAGGHKMAAGGQLAKEDLEKFKQNLKNYDIEKVRIKNEK